MKWIAAALIVLGCSTMSRAEDARKAEREAMVAEIERLAQSLSSELDGNQIDPRVLAAMREVPRHEFVPAAQRGSAYRNRPLAIGHGQTISQPFIVALMTDLLQLEPQHTALEVGTGSGYQAAVLSRLVREVYSIEIVAPLGEEATATLARLGCANVKTRIGDGYRGWPEAAPFDAIIVTAAPEHVPPALVEQLKPGGRMVIPVGDLSQDLMLIEKTAGGDTVSTSIIPVRFVPLVHGKP